MKICAYCKSRVFPQDRKCPSCGSTVFIADADEPESRPQPDMQQPQWEQPQWQQPQQPQTTYYTQTVYAQAHSPRNRWVALALCVLGGYLGLHRFYAGKVFTGLLYLCTVGFGGIGIIIDGISLLVGSFRDGQGRLMA